ncbi:MAG: gliding motility-associated C-terminal domain-containing protein [Bacteroidales bacterium]|nr:gliding motility-associated C-terminal domain-containing protein [Bacteroidales bacterium]
MLFLMVAGARAQGYDENGYNVTSGIDASLWADVVGFNTASTEDTITLPFDFYFMGYYYRHLVVNNPSGSLRFVNDGPGLQSFDNDPIAVAFSTESLSSVDSTVLWNVIGQPGAREVVFAFNASANAYNSVTGTYQDVTANFQIHLSEATNSVTFQYFHPQEQVVINRYGRIYLAGQAGDSVIVDRTSGFLGYLGGSYHVLVNTWPANYKYFRLTPTNAPQCGGVGYVFCETPDPNSYLLRWHTIPNAIRYHVRYWALGSTMADETYTTDTFAVYHRRNGVSPYEFTISSICGDAESESEVARYRIYPPCQEADYPIHYWDFADPSVTCYTGVRGIIADLREGVVNHGPDDYSSSRHTVHTRRAYDPYATDLDVVPTGYCSSVRLGNANVGAQFEAIRYTIDVDTNIFSLLAMSYALVEEQPYHPAEAQPKFMLRITDANDMPIDNCYDITFVAGDNVPGCQEVPEYGIVWMDWQTVGLDLAPLHGQRVYVWVENYDCSAGAHFGYAYFAMRGMDKLISSEFCGDAESGTLRAPAGFNYRWYSSDNPSETLSTADTLTIPDAGDYSCECTFIHSPQCGFTISTVVTAQYPQSQFTFESSRIDSCHYQLQFHNQSRVTSDAAHTQPSDKSCTSYIWEFDDGEYDSQDNPSHNFLPGHHWAQLKAIVGNGQCYDISRQEFDFAKSFITVVDSICDGRSYELGGQTFDRPGTYDAEDDCYNYVLNLTTYHYAHHELEATVCQGEPFLVGDSAIYADGYHTLTLTAANGCDSTVGLNLHVRPLPSSVHELYNTCHGDAYYFYKDTFQLADSALQSEGSRTFLDNNNVAVTWQTMGEGEPLPYFDTCGLLRLDADSIVTYSYRLFFSYIDDPQCPVSDTILVLPIKEIYTDMEVWPGHLTSDRLDYWAQDLSRNATARKWAIDGILQADTTRRLYASARPDADSVVVKLIAYNNSCQDSTEKTLQVLRHLLMFPNVFTPSLSSNNTFGPAYNNVSDYELWIYDRRGDLVYHTTDILQPWDGTYEGSPCRQETYVYTCTYTTAEYGKNRQVGTVTLLR